MQMDHRVHKVRERAFIFRLLFFSISSIQTHVYPTNNAVTTRTLTIFYLFYLLSFFVTVVFIRAFSRHRAAAAAQHSAAHRNGNGNGKGGMGGEPQRGILSLCFALDGWVGGWDGVWIGLDQIGVLPFDELITAVFRVLLMSFFDLFL